MKEKERQKESEQKATEKKYQATQKNKGATNGKYTEKDC